jgi:TPR repeat protein
MSATDYNPDQILDAFVRKDYETILHEVLPHAITGNPVAQCSISLLYQCGFGVARDLAKAEEWLLKAAAQNDPVAWNNLGTLYIIGGEGLSRGREAALDCYVRAKELGFACAQPYPPPSE